MNVSLNDQEVMQAAVNGALRRAMAVVKGRTPRYGYSEEDPWRKDIEAVGAEMAVAKVRNRYYVPAVGALDYEGDVGEKVQVRSSSRSNARLILHPDDADDHYFVLVINDFPDYTVVGWCKGAEGKQEQFWSDPGTGRPAFFVPQAALHPIQKQRT